MGRPTVLNDFVVDFIHENFGKLSICKMADKLSIDKATISKFLGREGKIPLKKHGRIRDVEEIPDGIFDVNERENWVM